MCVVYWCQTYICGLAFHFIYIAWFPETFHYFISFVPVSFSELGGVICPRPSAEIISLYHACSLSSLRRNNHQSINVILGIHSELIPTCAALFIVANNYSHFQGSSIGEWPSNSWPTHVMEHYAYGLIWKDLQNVLLSEKASFRTLNKAGLIYVKLTPNPTYM